MDSGFYGLSTTSTGMTQDAQKPRAEATAALAVLHKQVEEGLALACKLEDALCRVLRGSYPNGETPDGAEVKRDASPLTEELEIVAGKVKALNSRLNYVLSRLDV